MALQTISIHFAVGEVVEPRGTDRIAIGADVDLFLGFGAEAVKENAVKLIMAAQALIIEAGADAIDEAKRAREIAETERRVEAAERIAGRTEYEFDREGEPAFNGSFR